MGKYHMQYKCTMFGILNPISATAAQNANAPHLKRFFYKTLISDLPQSD